VRGWLLVFAVLTTGACGEDPLAGQLFFSPEPDSAELQDAIVAITLFEFNTGQPDKDARAIELFTIRDPESTPIPFDFEPKQILNERGYYITVHADLNANQRIDEGDYINGEMNFVYDGEDEVAIVLQRQ
jgi:hypothetical protein